MKNWPSINLKNYQDILLLFNRFVEIQLSTNLQTRKNRKNFLVISYKRQIPTTFFFYPFIKNNFNENYKTKFLESSYFYISRSLADQIIFYNIDHSIDQIPNLDTIRWNSWCDQNWSELDDFCSVLSHFCTHLVIFRHIREVSYMWTDVFSGVPKGQSWDHFSSLYTLMTCQTKSSMLRSC